ncbi:DUF2971 domain-containing protein [Vibrio fluvialis]|uniref:DUF2971 domain-containing protein n=1 Tax=Vibrio fluvialis TaxID=676 RepID=UPI001EEBE2F9|nr:DUF2971 domain-containing protein [Vibrio fluvialis]MCG6359131.1 DUF2971 domain-containing protein [Vibrio fluvialis]
MRNYENSAIWGTYGDEHKGVCLIFEPIKGSDIDYLSLTPANGYNSPSSIFQLHDIDYQREYTGINFFESIGCLSKDTIKKYWLMLSDGSESKYLTKIQHPNWKYNYRMQFLSHITTKSKDWENENERRVLMTNSPLNEKLSNDSKSFSYDFKSLKGVIFGIKTSNEDKAKIIKILRKKCTEHNITNFELYQAAFCNNTRRIKAIPIEAFF